mmetsp:Transcript_64338/g.186492  ORF Transcript_64338/g.186492 Transcript_64338/m.186492 type:complete len:353 (-) Transcript_64338:619-1677(-)
MRGACVAKSRYKDSQATTARRRQLKLARFRVRVPCGVRGLKGAAVALSTERRVLLLNNCGGVIGQRSTWRGISAVRGSMRMFGGKPTSRRCHGWCATSRMSTIEQPAQFGLPHTANPAGCPQSRQTPPTMHFSPTFAAIGDADSSATIGCRLSASDCSEGVACAALELLCFLPDCRGEGNGGASAGGAPDSAEEERERCRCSSASQGVRNDTRAHRRRARVLGGGFSRGGCGFRGRSVALGRSRGCFAFGGRDSWTTVGASSTCTSGSGICTSICCISPPNAVLSGWWTASMACWWYHAQKSLNVNVLSSSMIWKRLSIICRNAAPCKNSLGTPRSFGTSPPSRHSFKSSRR